MPFGKGEEKTVPREVRGSDYEASSDKVIQALKKLWPNLDTSKAKLHVVELPPFRHQAGRYVAGYNLALPHGSVEVDLILEGDGVDENSEHWTFSLARVYHFCTAQHLHPIATIMADGTISVTQIHCEHELVNPNG